MSFLPLIRAAKAEAAAVGGDGSTWSRRQQLGGHGVGFVDEEEEMSIWGPGMKRRRFIQVIFCAIFGKAIWTLSNRLWACKGRTPASDGSGEGAYQASMDRLTLYVP
ncbi:hypothetical protein Pyn_00878 [Prunus yedoensis var. nudiflora]|uniref:Uncharacterized protein n=1 Tax=Prunus yedoensis var. nudiflora TaxID=2094558 RepID=A0A314YD70_PRUYE|nr:hypothetical protein Pyn_00878 [Prunus yedoensis var. nudiflora]